jgi:hypothetical protein
MLDFEKLDIALESAVGIAPRALLQATSSSWAERFLLARERLSKLSELTKPSAAEAIERDRLASFFGCAYGDYGLLARAGTLYTVLTRLRQLGAALPSLVREPTPLGRIRREVAILRALALNRLSKPLHADDNIILDALDGLDESLEALTGFSLEAQQALRSTDTARLGSRLYGFADLTNVASDIRDGLTLGGAISFVLGRLADRGFEHEANALFDELCGRHATTLRRALWSRSLEGFSRREHPASLRELQELDVLLELLSAELTSAKRSGSDRADAVGTLLALLVVSHAEATIKRVGEALDGALMLVVEGLVQESKRT